MTLAKRLTDEEYVDVNTLEGLLEGYNTQAVWQEIQAYRKPYCWRLCVANDCFSLTLTPAILAEINALDIQLRFWLSMHPSSVQDDYHVQALIDPSGEPAFYLNRLSTILRSFSYEQLHQLMSAPWLVQLAALKVLAQEQFAEASKLILNRYFLSGSETWFLSLDIQAGDGTADLLVFMRTLRQRLNRSLSATRIRYSNKSAGKSKEELLALYPFLSEKQALFYCTHQQVLHNYTIKDYAKACECSLETARTALNQLCDLGWYQRYKIGKKFIYRIG